MFRWVWIAVIRPGLMRPPDVRIVPRRIFHRLRAVLLALRVRSLTVRVVGPAVVEDPVLLGHLLGGNPVRPGRFGEGNPIGLGAEAPAVCPRLVLDRLV